MGYQMLGSMQQTPQPQVAGQPPSQPMILCPKCGVQNPSSNKHCAECGTKLMPNLVPCPKCGERSAEGTKFCPNCGSSMVNAKKCPNCGAMVPMSSKFCLECGKPT
jgi:uncharacterized membrane protein YvbJ